MPENATTGPSDLARALREMTSPEVVLHISSLVSESAQSTQKACEACLVALVRSVSKLASGNSGPSSIAAWLQQGARVGMPETDFREMLGSGERAETVGRAGTEVARAVFGRDLPRVTESVRNQAGMKASTAASILSLMSAMFAATLEEVRRREGLDEPGLLKLVRRQRTVMSDLFTPASATTSKESGIGGSLLESAARLGGAAPRTAGPQAALPRRRSHWQSWAVGAVTLGTLAILAGSYFGGRPRAIDYRSAPSAQITLPNGAILRNPAPIVKQITEFLASTSNELPKRFTLNQVAFYRDSNRMKSESADTIDQLAAIVNAYPKLAVRIEGRSELTGERELQQRLALDRANAVKARIEASGASASQIETAGVVAATALDSSASIAEHDRANRTEIVITRIR